MSRYAIHLISASHIAALKRKATKIDKQDIKRCYELFFDLKRSTTYLNEYQQQFYLESDEMDVD